jgi:hypothetical protein
MLTLDNFEETAGVAKISLKRTPQAVAGLKPLCAGNEAVRVRNRRLCERDRSKSGRAESVRADNKLLCAGDRSSSSRDKSEYVLTRLLRAHNSSSCEHFETSWRRREAY